MPTQEHINFMLKVCVPTKANLSIAQLLEVCPSPATLPDTEACIFALRDDKATPASETIKRLSKPH